MVSLTENEMKLLICHLEPSFREHEHLKHKPDP